jgi:hypothetical protein
VVRQYQLPAADVTVTCPDGIPEVAGRSFKCQATVAGQTLPIDGTVTNSAGRYRTRPGAAVIVLSSVAAELQSRVAAQERAPARVFCGDQAILVVPAGGSFSCTSMVAGHNRQLTVTVDDLEGHVHFSVAGGPAAQPQSS